MDRAARVRAWLGCAYKGQGRELRLALGVSREDPEFFASGPDAEWLACARGDEAGVRAQLSRDEGWATKAGGPLGMTPLVAVTHSMLGREAELEAGLLGCARLLLAAGADVNARWVDTEFPDWPLSALYGAAGRTRSVAMAKLLLEAGADPNDQESLYHSVEGRDAEITRLLLEHGARVTGTNAAGRALDFPETEPLRLLLAHGADVNEAAWVHHAILRGRGMEQVRMLADAGANLRALNHGGVSLWRFAAMLGRSDVLGLLRERGIEETLSAGEEFVAACSRGDEARARELLEQTPDMLGRLTPAQLRALPELAATGGLAGVRTMLAVGWPREVKAGWGATALNWAVYRGDAEMAEVLLRAGADWRTEHHFKDNLVGTLAWASRTQEDGEQEDRAAPGDYVGCARVLMAHGVPLAEKEYGFSDEVRACFEGARVRGVDPGQRFES